jgi:hypothetical protein
LARAGTLDAHFEIEPVAFGWGLHSMMSHAQTFTAGQTGTLDRIELQVWREQNATEPLIVELRRTLPSGGPDLDPSALLATLAFQASFISTTQFTSFAGLDLGEQSFPVSAGDQFAIVAMSATSGSDGTSYAWSSSDSGPAYAFGQSYHRILPSTEFLPGLDVRDLGFRTFVLVPEPPSLLLAASVFILIAWSLQRTHRASAG